MFGFDKLLIYFGTFYFNGFLVDLVLSELALNTWPGHQQHRVSEGTHADYGRHGAQPTTGLCLGRIWFAVPPVNLQNKIGILGFSEWSRVVFLGLPLKWCLVAWDKKQRFISRGNLSSLWWVIPGMACQLVSNGCFFLFPECLLLITKNQVFPVSVLSISVRKWLISVRL